MGQKYVIGLTGNIATGKSIVRRMLQELGASAVDADKLVHMLQRPGTSVYKEIVDTFGSFVLNSDATINRQRLGEIAFNIPEALKKLESITHPAVRQHLLRAIDKAPKDIVVIEAIKLLESGLSEKCDAIWVVTSPEELQIKRLITKRKMSQQHAIQRVKTQSPQEEKVAKADVVIDNSGDLLSTWNLVQKRFSETAKPPVEETPAVETAAVTASSKTKLQPVDKSSIETRRANRSDLSAMAELVVSATQGELNLTVSDMMERLFTKGYMVAIQDETIVGMVGWQTENLIAGLDDFFVKSSTMWPSVGKILIEEVEKEVAQLSCEAGLIFLHNKVGSIGKRFLEKHGYEEKVADDLIRDWRDAAKDWQGENTTLLVKQLLERRVMTPI